MNSWKEFFEKHGQSKVDNRPYASWSEVNIEDLYQAFKARLREEEGPTDAVRQMAYMVSPSEREPDELMKIKDKIKTGPR